MIERTHFKSIRFQNFKAFRSFSVTLREFNVLVGPNNSGKSTVIGAFRILSEGMRRANARKAELIRTPKESLWAYRVSLIDLPVATENVFHNYDNSEPAIVRFSLTNGNELSLIFHAVDECIMKCDASGKAIRTPSNFKREFNVVIGFVPILGPVEHNEVLYQKDAARLALLSHRASRNFRNIWHHYPDDFAQFREMIKATWPGMDIQPPEVDYSDKEPHLHMFCPEDRYPRELYWAGFGFQVWCQLITHVVKSREVSLFVIDEPDIYLHSDLQRQLLGILKGLGPDVLMATHSTEIISESAPEDLLVINKRNRSAKRIGDPTQIQRIFGVLGSNLNPILTQLAKSKKAVFVEGKDFQILSLFSRKLGKNHLANRSGIAVIPVEGYNVQKVQDFVRGMAMTLGESVLAAVVFDRDYRTDDAVEKSLRELNKTCELAVIHERKEIENYLLHPAAIHRAILLKVSDHNKRAGDAVSFSEDISVLLMKLSDAMKADVFGQYLKYRSILEKESNPGVDDATINSMVMREFEELWKTLGSRLRIIPGKQFVSVLNRYLQEHFKVTLTSNVIVSSFKNSEIPQDMISLIDKLEEFRMRRPSA